MIWRNTLLWRNVAEYSFLLVVVAAHSLVSFFFLHSDEFFFHKVAGREEFFNELLEALLRFTLRRLTNGIRKMSALLSACGEKKLARGSALAGVYCHRRKRRSGQRLRRTPCDTPDPTDVTPRVRRRVCG